MTDKELWEEIKKKVGEKAGDVGLAILFFGFGVFPAILTVGCVLWFLLVKPVARFHGLMD